MTKFRFAVVDIADTGVGLDQFCQISDVPYKTKRQLLRGPDASILLDFELLVELIQLQRGFFQITEIHVVCTCLSE